MRRRKTAIFFLVLGICLIVLAVALNVGWILLNLREVALLVLGIIFFAVIITGLVLNTIFLFREVRQSEQQDAFLNAVTHELKTPIASIKLYLETLKSRNVSSEKANEFYDTMLADSDRLLGTVEQVLQASRTRERKRQLNVANINITGLLNDSIATIRNRYNLDENVIRFTEPAEQPLVVGDETELRTAFVNLLDNAVKYSADEPKISIRTKLPALTNRIDIFIRDNGIGMPANELKRVFKRFHRVAGETASKTKGTGLGLFIVKSIVEKHGGRVRADSRGLGMGSTFMVQLPRVKE
ncbi:MAG TPA: HAMP domain-containing sensor histidine kinase [Pyrinomonadaceae bacterium]|nr:HAMP domain-containing sensor histidine kinase [Pyrinomonadaceae bacterium]